jgi:hypothetical protein
MPRKDLRYVAVLRMLSPDLDAVRATTTQTDLAPHGSNVLTASPRLSADTRTCSCVQIGLYGAFSPLTDAVANGRYRVIQWPYAAMRNERPPVEIIV